MNFQTQTITTEDGIQLFVRNYSPQAPTEATKIPVLCLHGFMRTGRDYNDIASYLASNRHVIVPDIRGRGQSSYAPEVTDYFIPQLLSDINLTLDQLALDRVVILGTTLGAILAMIMANQHPERVAGIILIDQGTETDKRGLVRMGQHGGDEAMTYEQAVATIKHQNETFFPDYDESAFAKMMLNAHRKNDQNMYVRDLDQQCRKATPLLLRDYGKADLWDEFVQINNITMLGIRGEFSDYVNEENFNHMEARNKNFSGVHIPRVGHPPQLNEVESCHAIDLFLEKI